jgi:hypothetical protein
MHIFIFTVELGYNDLELYDALATALYILWYQFTLRHVVFCVV